MLFHDNLDTHVRFEQERLARLHQANIPEVGVILAVLGPNEDQDARANPGGHSVTRPVERLALNSHGIEGDRHAGLTRSSTGRESALYRTDRVRITNRRQIFAVSPADCDVLSQRLEVEATPQLLGANLVIGREDGESFSLSSVPMNTYFVIASAGGAEMPCPPIATLVHYVQQQGCSRTGKAFARAYGDDSLVKRFVTHSRDHRGILCAVEYPADSVVYLEAGQRVFFKFAMGRCP